MTSICYINLIKVLLDLFFINKMNLNNENLFEILIKFVLENNLEKVIKTYFKFIIYFNFFDTPIYIYYFLRFLLVEERILFIF